MPIDSSTDPAVLTNKPLVEAILELRWRLEDTPNIPAKQDRGFRILLGRFFDSVKSEYPHLVDLEITNVPESLTPHSVRHQFRVAPDQWPLVQLGPGILTVNATDTYSWRSFRPRIESAVAALFRNYPSEIARLALISASLRFINAIPFDASHQPALDFLRDDLHTNISLSEALAEGVQDLRQPTGFQITLDFPMTTIGGVLGVTFRNGQVRQSEALIWQLVAWARDGECPSDEGTLLSWADSAHELIERWFVSLSSGRLYESFR